MTQRDFEPYRPSGTFTVRRLLAERYEPLWDELVLEARHALPAGTRFEMRWYPAPVGHYGLAWAYRPELTVEPEWLVDARPSWDEVLVQVAQGNHRLARCLA